VGDPITPRAARAQRNGAHTVTKPCGADCSVRTGLSQRGNGAPTFQYPPHVIRSAVVGQTSAWEPA